MSFNNNNNTGSTQNSNTFKGSWGSFSSRYDRQNNYKTPGNTAISNITPDTNVDNNRSAPQNQPSYEASKIIEFGNRMDSFLANQQSQSNYVDSNANQQQQPQSNYDDSNVKGFGNDSNVKGFDYRSFGANRQSLYNYDDSNVKGFGDDSNVKGFHNRMDSFGANHQSQANYDNSYTNRQSQSNYNGSNVKGFGGDSNAKGSGNRMNSFGANRQPQSNYEPSSVTDLGNRMDSFGASPQYQSNYKPSNVNDFGGNQRPQSNFENSNFKDMGSRKAGQWFQPAREQSDFNNFQNSPGSYRPNRNNDYNNKTQQNQTSFNNSGSRWSQYGSNNFGNKDRGGSWQSGSFNNGNSNKNSMFSNTNQSNTYWNSNNDKNNPNSSYVPFRNFRQYYTNRQHNDSASAANNKTPAPTLFMGRDPSYPDELNAKMNPFCCNVCNARLNSIKTANTHYVSKPHNKQITNWLKKNFDDKGLNPPVIKRFVTEEKTGPYRCELCKLDLTSAQHAIQHYNGKRHKNAAFKVSPPTGIGYYDVEGKWIETGKVMDKATGKEASYIMVNTPAGAEPVVLHVAPQTNLNFKKTANSESTKSDEPPAKKPNLAVGPSNPELEKIKKTNEENKQQQKKTMTPDSTTNDQNKPLPLASQGCPYKLQTPQDALNTHQCKICGIITTSYDQMLLHLKGKIHAKKLKALGAPPLSDVFGEAPTTTSTILESLNTINPSDISVYRTPTGQYYCQTCNVPFENEDGIKKHIGSKVHLAAMNKIGEESAKS